MLYGKYTEEVAQTPYVLTAGYNIILLHDFFVRKYYLNLESVLDSVRDTIC